MFLPAVTPRGQVFSLDDWEVKQEGGSGERKAGAAAAKSPEEMDIEDAFNLFDQFKTLTPSKVAALPTPVRIGIARAREEERLREEEEEREAAEGERRRDEEKRAREMEEERRINAELQEIQVREEAQRREERRRDEERRERERAEREEMARVEREDRERREREEEDARRRKASEDLAEAERQAAARSAAAAAGVASHPLPAPNVSVPGSHSSGIEISVSQVQQDAEDSSARWDEENKQAEESMRRLAEGMTNQVGVHAHPLPSLLAPRSSLISPPCSLPPCSFPLAFLPSSLPPPPLPLHPSIHPPQASLRQRRAAILLKTIHGDGQLAWKESPERM